MDDESLQTVYCWVDEIPLSRPKRNISRDFSDGVLMAEIIAHYFPRYVELHNYSQANSVRQKLYNWNTLNTKVFKKNYSALEMSESVSSEESISQAKGLDCIISVGMLGVSCCHGFTWCHTLRRWRSLRWSMTWRRSTRSMSRR